MAKLRSPADLLGLQRVYNTTGGVYRFLLINSHMGLNQMGFATANTACSHIGMETSGAVELNSQSNEFITNENLTESSISFSSWPYDPNSQSISNDRFIVDVLSNCASVQHARDFVDLIFEKQTSATQACYGFIDSYGDSTIYEINCSYWWREYYTLNPNRIAQNTYGFGVRATEWHYRDDGTDDVNIVGTTFESGTFNLRGMIADHNINVNTIARGTAEPNEGYEFLRYGPNRELEEIAAIRNRCAMIVHGVAPGEDPWLATMWVVLGPSNYSIAVPTWVKVESVPDCIGAGTNGHMFYHALSLFNKHNELVTQYSVFPMEKHIFSEVIEVLLPHWRQYGTPSKTLMTRVEHQIVNDGYSLIKCLDLVRYDNQAPQVNFGIYPSGMTLNFAPMVSDSDGEIASIAWNFGDNTTSSEWSPSHTYTVSGDYLISCTVTDDEGVTNTKWTYFQLPLSYNLSGGGQVGFDDFAVIAQNWLDACAEPFWCGGADFNQSGTVDFKDIAIFANGWFAE